MTEIDWERIRPYGSFIQVYNNAQINIIEFYYYGSTHYNFLSYVYADLYVQNFTLASTGLMVGTIFNGLSTEGLP